MDVTGDGNEELIVCSWEGHTYILDQNKHAIQFQTDEPVSAFCAGLYKLNVTKTAVPCLVYVTFSHKVIIKNASYAIKIEFCNYYFQYSLF